MLFLSAVELGYAIGPAIAGQLIGASEGLMPVTAPGAVCFLTCAAIYLRLAKRAARENNRGTA